MADCKYRHHRHHRGGLLSTYKTENSRHYSVGHKLQS